MGFATTAAHKYQTPDDAELAISLGTLTARCRGSRPTAVYARPDDFKNETGRCRAYATLC